MYACLAPGQYPAAIHRWFARGEDWAVHPQLAERLPEIVACLDTRLKSRETGPFRVSLAGGELVGELIDDADCLDRQAIRRRPVIVRLAYVPGQLSPAEREPFLAALRQVSLPVSPGINQGLIVSAEVRPRMIACSLQPQTPPPGSKGFRWVLVGIVAGFAFLAGLWYALKGPPPTRQQATASPSNRPEARLTNQRLDSLEALVRRYEAIDHPYVHFLLAHPEATERAMGPGDPSYDAWRGQQTREFTAAMHPLPRKLRERVARWRDLPPELGELCAVLREARRDWDPQALPRSTPIEEIEAFFESLVRPAGLPPREEFDHPANAFLWRLPRDVYVAGRTFDNEAEVRTVLRGFLNEQLQSVPPAPETTRSLRLIVLIGEALDYRAWHETQKKRGVAFADATAPLDDRLRQAIRRFERP
jgi:hypothetical protein